MKIDVDQTFCPLNSNKTLFIFESFDLSPKNHNSLHLIIIRIVDSGGKTRKISRAIYVKTDAPPPPPPKKTRSKEQITCFTFFVRGGVNDLNDEKTKKIPTQLSHIFELPICEYDLLFDAALSFALLVVEIKNTKFPKMLCFSLSLGYFLLRGRRRQLLRISLQKQERNAFPSS